LRLKHKNLFMFSVVVLVIAVVGTPISIYLTTPLVYTGWEKSWVQHGQLSGAGVPVNTLYTEPNLPSPNATSKSPVLLGNNREVLYTAGVLDLSKGPEVLSVPNMAGRYYDIEFVDTRGDDFAYLGTRTTATQAGNFLISGPGWHGTVPNGVTQITSPDNTVFLIGRVLVENDSDVSIVYNLSTQIHLTPLSSWQPSVG
jgi:hypothetical protein